MINFEGGAVPEEYHAAYIIDRVNTTGTVWLGLTVGCAQCHDHKFDPIKQKEYYGLYAFFHNVPENGLDGSKGNAAPLIAAPSAEQQADLERHLGPDRRPRSPDLRPRCEGRRRRRPSGRRRLAEVATWRALGVRSAVAASRATLRVGDDGTIVVDGENPAKERYDVTLAPDGKPITAIRLEVLPDDRYPNKGPGRSDNGNIVLTDVKLGLRAG